MYGRKIPSNLKCESGTRTSCTSSPRLEFLLPVVLWRARDRHLWEQNYTKKSGTHNSSYHLYSQKFSSLHTGNYLAACTLCTSFFKIIDYSIVSLTSALQSFLTSIFPPETTCTSIGSISHARNQEAAHCTLYIRSGSWS